MIVQLAGNREFSDLTTERRSDRADTLVFVAHENPKVKSHAIKQRAEERRLRAVSFPLTRRPARSASVLQSWPVFFSIAPNFSLKSKVKTRKHERPWLSSAGIASSSSSALSTIGPPIANSNSSTLSSSSILRQRAEKNQSRSWNTYGDSAVVVVVDDVHQFAQIGRRRSESLNSTPYAMSVHTKSNR